MTQSPSPGKNNPELFPVRNYLILNFLLFCYLGHEIKIDNHRKYIRDLYFFLNGLTERIGN